MKYRMKYRTTRPVRNAVALALGVSILFGSLSAYGSNASDLAKERVAQSETSVAAGSADAWEIRARRRRAAAGARQAERCQERSWPKKSGRRRNAQLRRRTCYAELAVAKSQSADARKSANEVLASLEMLRQETERTTPTQR